MNKITEKIEDIYEDIAYAEAGEYNPHHNKESESDSFEEVFSAIGMAEGGDDEYAKKLHPLFHLKPKKH